MANAIEDGEVINQKIFIRGNPKDLGEIAPKGFPKIFGSENVSINILKGSGRLQLARWLTQPDHPFNGPGYSQQSLAVALWARPCPDAGQLGGPKVKTRLIHSYSIISLEGLRKTVGPSSICTA